MKQVFAGVSEKSTFRRTSALLQAAVLTLAVLMPLLAISPASAAPKLSARSATIDKSYASATDVQFVFGYTIADTTSTKAGIIYDFCTQPLGACVIPTDSGTPFDAQTANDHVAQTGFSDAGTPFAADAEQTLGDCDSTTNAWELCYSRDEAVATGVTGGAVTHTISGIDFPDDLQTIYIRIRVYSNNDYASGNLIEEGTVAVAIVDQLTINGRVQERLNFCVQALGDADSAPATVAACTAIGDTNVDLGIIDETGPAVSPVAVTANNGADADYGILMLNTNATGGAVISYYPEVDAGGTEETRSFRVDNSTCTAAGSQPDETDQCFVDTVNGGTGTDLSGAGEGFGVHVACIEAPDTTANLGSVPAWYDADGTTTVGGPGNSDTNCESTDASDIFGWNESGTADTLASSGSVIDNEIVKIRFGARAATTTPSGEYTVVTTYIATVTF